MFSISDAKYIILFSCHTIIDWSNMPYSRWWLKGFTLHQTNVSQTLLDFFPVTRGGGRGGVGQVCRYIDRQPPRLRCDLVHSRNAQLVIDWKVKQSDNEWRLKHLLTATAYSLSLSLSGKFLAFSSMQINRGQVLQHKGILSLKNQSEKLCFSLILVRCPNIISK